MRRTLFAITASLCVAYAAPAFAQAVTSGKTRSGIAYEVRGKGPAVVLITGSNLDRRMWTREAEWLATGHTVVRYDLRAHGASDTATAPFSNVDDLFTLLDELRIDRATLVGLSAGSTIALDAALAQPSRVERLVLAGPSISGFRPTSQPALFGPLIAALKAKDYAKAGEVLLESPVFAAPPASQPLVRQMVMENDRLWSVPREFVKPVERPAVDRLEEVKVPTLVLIGEKDAYQREQADALAKRVAGARLVVVPEGGHLLNLTSPDQFRAAVTQFLSQPAGMAGYSAARAEAQRAVEATFAGLPSAERAKAFHRFFTAEPHPAASERNNELARYIADTWKAQGLEDVTIHRYDVLNSIPRSTRLEMVSPVKYLASLREDAYDVDPDTSNRRIAAGYLAMSRPGDVTAPIVYANSGNPADYDVLRAQGIDVRGKAVLVRYSNPYSYRGFKALTAERAGAAAILIYSDPAEDGFKKGAVFPDGPWGPESHIQRGAITYDFMVPGDPLTPGWASVPGAKQVSMDAARSMPKIVGLALSWRDAKPLLEHMGGPVAPDTWQGGLPITYRLGGEATVRVQSDMDNSVKPNFVVEARIRGSEFPDDLIVLGNHRDAWEFGGVDPSSGTASMMEMTRAFGEMLKNGVRPRRTLVFCSWDGEEVGLTGSTEWGEQFAASLKKNLVAYLNVDSSTSGPNFEATAVASMAPLLVDISRTLRDPSGTSLYDAWRATVTTQRREAKDERAVTDDDLVDTKIGSGSDHTVFLNHLGRPTAGLSFVGPYGVYHSAYDNFYWMNHFGDPGYRYHALMAQLWGVVALRLANADVLPFDFENYARHLRGFVKALEPKAGAQMDFGPLLERITAFEAAGGAAKRAIDTRLARPKQDARANQRTSRLLMAVEGNWLNPDGIPDRPWFKHMLYAARYTYAHLELPGLTEAVEAGNWPAARQQARLLEKAVAANTALLRQVR